MFLVCPEIIPKAGWGSQYRGGVILPNQPAAWVVVHHSTGDNCDNFADCSAQMRYLDNLHTNVFGWSDIGYNFCIGNDGSIFEGRGWNYQGLHSPGFNQNSLGVCFLGTFTEQLPSEEAMDALRSLVRCGVDRLSLSQQYYYIGHRQDVNTECPGEALFEELRTWPRFYDNL